MTGFNVGCVDQINSFELNNVLINDGQNHPLDKKLMIPKENYKKSKEEYLKFLKTQEVLSEPFRDKISQFKNFYLPISERIYKSYIIDKSPKIIGLAGGQGSGKSTISNILKITLKTMFNLNTVIFS